MKTYQLVVMSLATLFLGFCKSAKFTNAPKPMESYPGIEEAPISNISVPVFILVEDLNRSINNALPYVLYEDDSYTNNGKDNLKVRATRSNQRITLNVSGSTIKYNVPVRLLIKKNIYLGEAEIAGEISLGMRTTYTINSDWTMLTQTQVDYHEWIQDPVLRTGLGNINIESLANIALNNSKSYIAESVDQYFRDQFSLRPYVEEAWSAVQEPILLDETYQMWVKTTPRFIGMTPIRADYQALQATIGIECVNEVTFGEKPKFRKNTNLPNLTFLPDDTPNAFQARILADVPFAEAERLAKQYVLGQEFASGKRKVKVEDLELWGNNDKVVVKTLLSGSFNGNIYFVGRPEYNARLNQIEVQDLDFHVDTENLLHKSASWMFAGPIRKQMQKAMVFPLKENIDYAKASAQQTLRYYEIQPGVVLTGTVDTIAVEDTHVTPTGIAAQMFAKGRVQVDVKGL